METVSFILNVICTCLEIFFMYRVVDMLLSRRKMVKFFSLKQQREYSWLLLAILIPIFVVITLMLNQIALTSAYTAIIVMIANIFIVMIFWKSDFIGATAIIGGYFFVLFVVGTIEISITGMIGGDELIQETTMEQGLYRCMYLIIGGILWATFNQLFYKFIGKKIIRRENKNYIFMISVAGVIGFAFISSQMLIGFNVPINVAGYILLIGFSICIFTIYYVIKSRNLERQVQMLQAQNETFACSYESVSDYYKANARLYHDMKNHFYVLRSMLERGNEDEAKRYLDSLGKPMSDYVVTHWTGNDIIDTILSDKVTLAKKKEITIIINSQTLPNEIQVEKRDLCAIFANLLDNAIEASPKEIHVQIKVMQRMLYIQIENDYEKAVKKENKKYFTTKRNTIHHGWGLENVQIVINRYGGSMEIGTNNGIFSVEIVIMI